MNRRHHQGLGAATGHNEGVSSEPEAGPYRVLVVDDEPAFTEGLSVALGAEGFVVDVAGDGEQALAMFESRPFDLVLLDVMLPRISGIDVCRRIRAAGDTPVIMVSARGSEIDTVVGLEIGADDYVAKPYRVRELVARMRTVLRRASTRRSAAGGRISVGGVVVDRDRREASADGEPLALARKEFEVLALLIENAGRVVTRQTLMDRVWGFDHVGSTKTLDVHVKRLRAKIEADPQDPQRIVTVRRIGYMYDSAEPEAEP